MQYKATARKSIKTEYSTRDLKILFLGTGEWAAAFLPQYIKSALDIGESVEEFDERTSGRMRNNNK